MKNLIMVIVGFFVLIACEHTAPSSEQNRTEINSHEEIDIPLYKTSGDYNTVNTPFPKKEKTVTYESDMCGPDTYPCSPYGFLLYRRVENFPFFPVGSSANIIAGPGGIAWMDALYKLRLQGYKVLFVTFTSGWCGYCSTQSNILGTNIAASYDGQVAFLTVVFEDEAHNYANGDYALAYANAKNINGHNNIFITYDPAGLFHRYKDIEYMPFNFSIDLETMIIISRPPVLDSVSLYTNAVNEALSLAN